MVLEEIEEVAHVAAIGLDAGGGELSLDGEMAQPIGEVVACGFRRLGCEFLRLSLKGARACGGRCGTLGLGVQFSYLFAPPQLGMV